MVEHTIKLIDKSHHGDKEARDRLVEENLGLVWSIVRRFANRGYELEDLFQIGSIGLMKAIDKFDISYEVKFSTYAVPMIMGEIKRFLRDDGMIKMSRSIKENAYKIKGVEEKIRHKEGREPTLEEIKEATGLEKEDILMAMDACVEVDSIYRSVYSGDENEICLADKLTDKRNENEDTINRLVLQSLLEGLEEKERDLINLRYFQDKTQTETAQKLGISQVQVSRLEKRILLRMRGKLA
jgi:RNA polymerase sporulation-specific sigma factor